MLIYSTQKGETKYSVRLLPLGGYVSMEGEDGESNDPRAFGEKTLLQRASIIFAGPFFNIILTVLLLIPVLAYMGTPSDSNVLGKVLENTPAFFANRKCPSSCMNTIIPNSIIAAIIVKF